MRSGKLMTQSKPDDLIRAHNAQVCIVSVMKFYS